MANVTSEECEFTNKFANKSWVELYEEEHPDESNKSESNGDKTDSEKVKTNLTDIKEEETTNGESKEKKLANRPDVEDGDTLNLWIDEESRMSINSSPAKCTNTPPKNFTSYANALKSVSPENKTAVSQAISSGPENKKWVKREIQKDFLQDDLSLTSHLDVFHMQSPCKQNSEIESKTDTDLASEAWNKNIESNFPKINEWPLSGSTKKNSDSFVKQDVSNDSKEIRGGKRRLPLMQVGADGPRSQQKLEQIPDEVLMPSPSKIIRGLGNNTENTKSPMNVLVESRKRQRESYSSPMNISKNAFSSPSNKQRSSFSSPSQRNSFSSPSQRNSFSSPSNRSHSEIEYETDPTILTRRQKQIDYGKNTIGYERYTSEISRDKREKNHPKTPPRHLKYSRRAWDGLVKNWRRRLHYWDPPSEGGGNPELLEDLNESDMSEFSGNESYSLPNSLPSTPQQDWKRRKAKNSERSLEEDCNDYYINDKKCLDDEGFKPLDDV